jgi:hypothetical protein
MPETARRTAFNTPLETGVRSLAILVAAYPSTYDLQRLVELDYLVVHSGDADGPESLHPPLPLRAGELLVRRALIERGLLLMLSRSFVSRRVSAVGIEYQASESAASFLAMLQSEYILLLRVHYSKEMSDFVIDGKPRGSRGKGLRAISHAAVTLGLLEYCQERSLPHPGFVVMGSPLLACFKPEGRKIKFSKEMILKKDSMNT